MRHVFRGLAVVMSVAALPTALAVRPAQTRSLVLDKVRVIDGTGAAAIARGRVVIDGDRIVRIGPAATVPAPTDGDRLDLSGRTMVPDLIDLRYRAYRLRVRSGMWVFFNSVVARPSPALARECGKTPTFQI